MEQYRNHKVTMTYEDMAETLVNGNISDFKEWVKGKSKHQLLDFIIAYVEYSGDSYEEAVHRMARYV